MPAIETASPASTSFRLATGQVSITAALDANRKRYNIERRDGPARAFDDDYLHFYTDVLGAGRSDADAGLVARLLSLEPGMRVLDVPCGEGRIAGRLARLGCEVVGVDYTERWVELARKHYPEATFELGDMRSLPYAEEFDAVVNWFTSFGYFDPETNDRIRR
jgi:2-polyprenyl-3-methyl-5-hydroxy-6-metoxy-1,4-benzoquinol methylase